MGGSSSASVARCGDRLDRDDPVRHTFRVGFTGRLAGRQRRHGGRHRPRHAALGGLGRELDRQPLGPLVISNATQIPVLLVMFGVLGAWRHLAWSASSWGRSSWLFKFALKCKSTPFFGATYVLSHCFCVFDVEIRESSIQVMLHLNLCEIEIAGNALPMLVPTLYI